MLELDARQAYDRLGPAYPDHAANAVMKAEQRAMLTALPCSLAHQRVLDAGCGTGRYMRVARERRAAQVIGVDLSLGMLQANREAGRVQASVTQLPVPTAWADTVICALVLGHVADLGAAVRELARVVRADGRIICTDIHPVGATRGWRRTFGVGDEKFAIRHVWRDAADWRTAAASAALRVRRFEDVFLAPADVDEQTGFDLAALELPVVMLIELEPSGRPGG